MIKKIRVKNELLTKQLVAFTWDDNLFNHSLIADIFNSFGLNCTFYINPGHDDFYKYSNLYKKLAVEGHEIGNHGLHHISYLDKDPLFIQEELTKSQQLIAGLTGNKPYTMAFPYHYYSEKEVIIAKKTHIETRNTLDGSIRIDLNTKSNIDSLIKQVSNQNCNIVFSGHSVNDEGYEPISTQLLYDLVNWIVNQENMHITTFLLASIIRILISQGSKVDENYIDVNELLGKLIE